jgi:hypothetical protein
MTQTGSEPVYARAGEAGYAAATRVFNLHAPARPEYATTVRTVDQIRAALRHARRHGLTVRAHSTGHGAPAARPMDGALLLRVELDGDVELDTARRVARLPAGTRWGRVADVAGAHGLAAPHGTSADVGVVGYLLRGGLSVYGRSVGLAVNSVRAVELVTADGELRRTDVTTDPELFWALRGGGGGFGVVTAVEVELFPADRILTGATYWPGTLAGPLLHTWVNRIHHAPRAVTSSLQVLNLPDLPVVPAELRSGTVIAVAATVRPPDASAATARAYAAELLDPLRALGQPLLEDWRMCAPAEVVHAQLGPDEPVPVVGDHMLLTELDETAVADFLAVTGPDSGSPLITAELRALGGAFAEPVAGGGALDHLDAAYAYQGSAIPMGPVTSAAIEDHCARVRAALRPWDTGRTAPTLVESVDQPQGHLDADRIRAVDRVRARVDPTGLFRGDVLPGATATR